MKIRKIGLAVALLLTVITPMSIYGQDFTDEDIPYYITYCSKPLNTQEDADTCKAFKEWYKGKADDFANVAKDLESQINALEGTIAEKGQAIENLREYIATLEYQIQLTQESIDIAEEEIYQLSLQIAEKEEEVAIRDSKIKQRMVDTQSFIGVNAYIDVIMGASDLVDLIRRVSVLQDITQFEQDEISKLDEMITSLNLDKSESDRLLVQMEEDKATLITSSAMAAEQMAVVQQAQYDLLEQEAALLAAKREADSASQAVLNTIPTLNDEVFNAVAGNSYIMNPLGGSYYISAGTWAYPQGSMHLGLDFACSVGTAVVAPVNGIILYANNPVGSTGGYLGNWVGWPAGGGNTVSMVGTVNGTTYMFSFFHLSQSPWYASAGQSVVQGQQIAASGHSGNSTGPHLHFEVINMGSMSQAEVYNWFKQTADFSGGTGWSSTGTSCSSKGSTPCRERPEDMISY